MSIERVDLDQVEDNPYQPRSSYSTNAVRDLAYSIKEIGMIHTPTARRVNGKFQLAEGHVRLRAYRKLAKQDPKKWGQIPLDIKSIPDTQMAIISLEENLRRDDLTPIETARAIEKYMTLIPDATETALGKKINMTQGNISNMRRVLKCPDEILQKIVDGRINFTMARELLIFHGLNAGSFSRYIGADEPAKQKDEKWLMLEAVKGIKTSPDRYGEPATIEGMKRCIYSVCRDNFRHLDKDTTSYSWQSSNTPLFDTRTHGCLKCPKMIRAYRVKTEASHFCTDRECWDKLQEEHKQKQKAEAQKKMQEDIAKRLTGTEEERQQEGSISEKYPDIEEMLDEDEIEAMYELYEEEEDEEERKEAELPGFEKVEELCRGCINTKQCANTRRPLFRNDKGFACASRTTKERFKELREQAKAKMPSAFSDLVKAAGGTRAEVLDIRVLRVSSYNDEDLQSGYILLSGHSYAQGDSPYGGRRVPTMDLMDDPEECTDWCTNGFHYAFDSSDTEAKVQHVCTRPKCFAQKKAALTRAKNNAGQERKKTEAKAIKQAITNTTSTLDKARLKLILYAQVAGKHTGKSYYNITEQESTKVLVKLLGVELKKDDSYGEEKTNNIIRQIVKGIDALTEEALAKVVVEFMLSMLTYDGEVKNYKIVTTEPLKWLGVNIPNIEKKEK